MRQLRLEIYLQLGLLALTILLMTTDVPPSSPSYAWVVVLVLWVSFALLDSYRLIQALRAQSRG